MNSVVCFQVAHDGLDRSSSFERFAFQQRQALELAALLDINVKGIFA
jgi:hypothetical protein